MINKSKESFFHCGSDSAKPAQKLLKWSKNCARGEEKSCTELFGAKFKCPFFICRAFTKLVLSRPDGFLSRLFYERAVEEYEAPIAMRAFFLVYFMSEQLSSTKLQ